MKDILSKIIKRARSVWNSIGILKKSLVIVIGIILIAVVVAAFFVGRKPQIVAVLTNPITDQLLLEKISIRLDEENISYNITNDGKIMVQGKAIAREARNILIREKLLPTNTDPWNLFDVNRWTQTDFERDINLRRSITKQLIQHIEALDDIDNAEVTLVMPEDKLFSEEKDPVSASVILSIKPGSDFRENRKKIEGVQQLILLAVEGLVEDNLTVSDNSGVRLNDFKNLSDFDRLEQTEREISIRRDIARKYKEAIYKSLSDIYTEDRVRIININVDIDFNKKTRKITENFPIVVKKDNPATPFDESEVTLSIPVSEQNTLEKFQGTGFNPEGPPGVEGQTPPSYKDLDGIVGDWDRRINQKNNEINQQVTNEERNYDVTRVTASVAIDGTWQKNYDEKGKIILEVGDKVSRTYYELSNVDMQKALVLVSDAVGYSIDRGDSVSVENIQFDRTAQFEAEDAEYLKKLRRQQILHIGFIVLVAAIVLFIIMRLVVRFVEEYKLRREERLAEQYRRMREQQLAAMSETPEIEEESDIERMSREIAELIKEKPEDIVHLVRSWIEGR